MCLTVKKGCGIKTAKKDITVYKRVYKQGAIWIPFYQPAGSTALTYNEVLEARDDYDKLIKHLVYSTYKYDARYVSTITFGFHSLTKKRSKYQSGTNVICIIPKGSEYCYGDADDVVSTKLIVFKTKQDYIQYKWNTLKKSLNNYFLRKSLLQKLKMLRVS